MKLYSTITSERATKGQGGNEYLDIEITYTDKNNKIKPLRKFLVTINEDNHPIIRMQPFEQVAFHPTLKDKKQKTVKYPTLEQEGVCPTCKNIR